MLNKKLEEDLERLNKRYLKEIQEIKDILFGEGEQYKGELNTSQLLENYKCEKEFLKKKGCKDSFELSDKLVLLERAKYDLMHILSQNKRR